MNFFKREPKKTIAPKSAQSKSLQDIFAPIPVADVSESTWTDWEDSVAFLNSQADQLPEDAADTGTDRPSAPPNDGAPPTLDPFASEPPKRR